MPEDRRGRFVSIVWEMAEDDTYGYSQKPPSGRWGPDFDCASFVYEAAHRAGYDVGRGGDKVRFTGTLLEDFKKAGFQILPFANVGLNDLEIGDILVNLALHAEVYVGEKQSVGAMFSENGGFVGKSGDQTGHEIEKHPVYELDKGWDYVVRPPKDDGEEDDSSEEDGEGASEMPSYPNMGGQMGYGANTWPGRTNATWTPPYMGGYQQMNGYPQEYSSNYGNYGNPNQTYQQGYPQGNLGQMNGYSQANAGMPMGPQGQGHQVMQAASLEEAKNIYVAPGDCIPIFNWNDRLMYWKSADKDGIPSMRVFRMEECSEDMPQHHEMYAGTMPMPQQMGGIGDMVTRQEFEQLKEMVSNAQPNTMGSSAGPNDGYRQGGEPNASQPDANGKQQANRNGRNA